MVFFILLLLKLLAIGVITAVAAAILNFLLQMSVLLLFRKNFPSLGYLILVSPLFIYVYTFVAAGFHSVIDTYIDAGAKGWVVYLIAIVFLSSFVKFLRAVHQKKQSDHDLNPFQRLQELGSEGGIRDQWQSQANDIAILFAPIFVVAFIVFFFTGEVYNGLYFGLPRWVAELFL